MAAEPSWIALAAPSITIFIAVGGIFWSRARTSGQDSTRLGTACDDIAATKKVTADHEKTLAMHTTLHEQHSNGIESLENRMLSVESKAATLEGRVNGGRRANG